MKERDTDSSCNCSGKESPPISEVVKRVIAEIGREADMVIPILQGVQDELNYLPSDAIRLICELTDITPAQITGVATFYSQFRHIPHGEHTIKICMGTACHVKGAGLVADAFRRFLGLAKGETTTTDKRFSLEDVACLGCCTLAPVVQIGSKTYGYVQTVSVAGVIDDFLNSPQQEDGDLFAATEGSGTAEIRVGLGSCCIAGGSDAVMLAVRKTVAMYRLDATVKPVGCVGVCNQTPLLEIALEGREPRRYRNVKGREVEEILLKHLRPHSALNRVRRELTGWIDSLHTDELDSSQTFIDDAERENQINNFLQYQKNIATEFCGIISPLSISEYCRFGGFRALEKVLSEMTPQMVIGEVLASGLRGMGGGGFPTGKKWQIVASQPSPDKMVICNGDEGDPGAFMDRMLLESFPFRVIEGMLIAARATGATEGVLYIRAEYPLAVERIRESIAACRGEGLLGSNILGSDFSFDLKIFEGAGAFVCGEETALIASVEGRRGTPHYRPPYPAVSGLYGKPTLVNNVETYCMIPWILREGASQFNAIGTDDSKGTKVFALAGKVARGGLIEVPMGITIRRIVESIGEGVADGRQFKAVQIGGPSGGCLPERLADTPIDFDALTSMGAMMGSGGLVVLDDHDCMVDVARYFLTFTHEQSCGKCTFCRVGTGEMLQILDRLCEGDATESDIDELGRLSGMVKEGSLCGLGKTAPNPVITSLNYFRSEYEAHARGICPAGRCQALINYMVNDNCIGCTRCVQVCPVDAIPFTPHEKHVIDNELCTACDSCREVCPANAIEKGSEGSLLTQLPRRAERSAR